MIINKKILILIIFIIISLLISLIPVSISVPFQRSEQFVEEYKVVEPRVIQVADYNITNVTVNEQFTDVRYLAKELNYSSNMKTCIKGIPYSTVDLAYNGWGSYYTIPYGDTSYFSGYKKGKISSKDIYTFDAGSKSGHVYNVLMNDNIVRILNESDYLYLKGYSLQVNSIDKEPKKVTIRSCRNGGHSDDDEDSGGGCTYSYRLVKGAEITLSDNNIVKTEAVEGGNTFIYQKTLEGGETVPMIAIHIGNISDNVIIDGVFQISDDYVRLPSLGSEITVTITNIDTVSGTFGLWEGFTMENDTSTGKFNEAILLPSESKDFTFTTNKDVIDCDYYTYSTSKKSSEEKFSNYRDVIKHKKRTVYRNVTLYVDVIKNRTVERNVSGYELKEVSLYQKILNYINGND